MKTGKTDHSNMKLGKLNPVHDPQTLMLANYIDPEALPAIPEKFVYAKNIKAKSWGMMANDHIGDCTCAAAGHLIMEWTDANGAMVTPADKDIIAAYAAITGYNPVTGKHDKGAVEIKVLNYWRKTGIASHKILAYAALEPGNHDHIRQSVYLFGGCYIGMALPVSAQTQRIWSVPPGGPHGTGAPGSWGGHAVPVIGYDTHGLNIITWGATKRMTWAFWDAYCDESYALLSSDFAGTKPAPNGFDLAALQADLKEIVG